VCAPRPVYRGRCRVALHHGSTTRIGVIQVTWWESTLFLVAVAFAIWGFISMVGFRTRTLTRGHGRTAEDLYPNYADSARKQRRYAREHGGEWHDDEPG
jgi:hypothetical protein